MLLHVEFALLRALFKGWGFLIHRDMNAVHRTLGLTYALQAAQPLILTAALKSRPDGFYTQEKSYAYMQW